jgi:hypothetical protein
MRADVGVLRSPVCGRLIAFDGNGGQAIVHSDDRAFGDVAVRWQADAVTLAGAGISSTVVGDPLNQGDALPVDLQQDCAVAVNFDRDADARAKSTPRAGRPCTAGMTAIASWCTKS